MLSSSLHNDLARMSADFHKRREELAEAVKEMRAVTASVTTDRMLKVTVDARGRLTEVVLRGNRWRELSPKELGATFLDAVTKAQDKAMASVTSVVAPVVPEGVDLAALIGGAPVADGVEGRGDV